MSKKELPRNPATYSQAVIDKVRMKLPEYIQFYSDFVSIQNPSNYTLLDPFAGTGKIFQITEGIFPGTVKAIELEPEWAAYDDRIEVGDALNLLYCDDRFDFAVTSPPYGNRMADDFEAKDGSKRHTYRHYLGRPLSKNSSANLQWSHPLMLYQLSMTMAYVELRRVMKHNGIFFLNISDHIRAGKRMRVAQWHFNTLRSMGFTPLANVSIETPRQRHGENGNIRVPIEKLFIFKLDKIRPITVDKYAFHQ